MNRAISNHFLNTTLSSYTVDWVNRCLKIGSKPSYKTIITVNNFLKRLNSYNILPKMKILCGFAPDSLAATMCPIYKTHGNNNWINNNFIESDLTINGLKGNGINKYFSGTGWIPNQTFSQANGGMTVYCTEYDGSAEAEFGSWTDTTYKSGAYMLLYSNTFYCDMWDDGNGRVFGSAPSSNWVGFFSGNRTSTNSHVVYIANSTTSHQAYLTKTVTISTLPSSVESVIMASSTAGTIGFYSKKRVSFLAIHDGLTQSENKTLYDEIYLYRQMLGGGFI